MGGDLLLAQAFLYVPRSFYLWRRRRRRRRLARSQRNNTSNTGGGASIESPTDKTEDLSRGGKSWEGKNVTPPLPSRFLSFSSSPPSIFGQDFSLLSLLLLREFFRMRLQEQNRANIHHPPRLKSALCLLRFSYYYSSFYIGERKNWPQASKFPGNERKRTR